MKYTKYLLIFILATVSQANAQTEDDVRFYDVEIVIFKNIKGPRSHEYILPKSSPRTDGDILDLSSPASVEAAKEKLYEIIPVEEMRLTETVLSIVNSDRYGLLAYVAWRQPGVEKEQALPIWIKGGRVFGDEFISIDNQIDVELMAKTEYLNSQDASTLSVAESSAIAETSILPGPENESSSNLYELEGKITIGLSRYLHTYADLVLRKPRLTLAPSTEEINFESPPVLEYIPDTKILNNHSLKERRRMRSNKLHYLDSPEFSMLVLITPYERPEVVENPQDLLPEGESIPSNPQ